MAAYTRAEIDALVDAELNVAAGGPVAKPELNNLLGFILDYIDGGNAEYKAAIGTVPTVTGLSATINNFGPIIKLVFTFTDVAVTHTDAAGSGSSGSLKIFDFATFAIQPLASRSNFTFASDTTMDVAGDLAMVYGFGSAAANAGDGALTGTEVDFAAVSGTVTFSSNAATSASLLKGAGTAIDGTSTAVDLYFNESATAATSDANGVLTVNGTAEFLLLNLGDD